METEKEKIRMTAERRAEIKGDTCWYWNDMSKSCGDCRGPRCMVISELLAELEAVEAELQQAKKPPVNAYATDTIPRLFGEIDTLRKSLLESQARELYYREKLVWITKFCDCALPRSCDCSVAHQDVAQEALNRTTPPDVAEIISKLVGALEQSKFALQMMIIQTNGPVPGLTAQQVFDGGVQTREQITKTLSNTAEARKALGL